MLKKTLICSALTSLLGGCAHVALTAPRHAEVLPASYKHATEQSQNNVPRQWWQLYRDDTLNQLVEATLRDNPYTRVAHLRMIAAEAQKKQANANRLPQLGAAAGFSNARTSTNTALGEILGHRTISGDKYTLGFDAAWQLDVWNRVGYAVAAADAGIEAERAYARMVEQTLSWEVAITYWQYRLAEAELTLFNSIRQQRAEAESVLAGRHAAGLISELDLARARLALRNADVDIEGAKERMSHAEHELATLAVKPVAQFSVPQQAAYRLPEIPAISPGLPAAILQRRPDLAQSAQNIRALLAQKEIADTAFYPSISLTGNFGFASLDLRNLTNSDSRQFSLGPVAISLPILDGGRIRASQKVADARYQEAVNVHKVQLLIALREVDDALSEVEASRNQDALLQAALLSARRVAQLAHARYDKGAVNYLEVAEAERELSNAELNVRRNHLKGLLASTQLIYALGGGWQDAAPAAAG